MKSQEILETKPFRFGKHCGIYKITNLVNQKVYIGSSKNIFHRIKYGHIYELNLNKHKNSYLQRSWNKYSSENFEFEILEMCEEDLLLEREQYHLDHYGGCISEDNYNNKDPERLTVSNETKKKMSEKMMGVSYKDRCGKEMSELTKKKMSESRMGITYEERFGKEKSDEMKKNLSEKFSGELHPLFGLKRSESTKNKISESRMGVNFVERFGKELADEMKKNLSEKNKGVNNNSAILNEQEVKEIKLILNMIIKYNLKITLKMVSEMFNIEKSTVENIRKNKNWKHVKIDDEILYYEKTFGKGEHSVNTNLTNDIVREIKIILQIRKETDIKLTYNYIAEMFNTTYTIIKKINLGSTWKHISLDQYQ